MVHGEAWQEAGGVRATPTEHMLGPSFPARELPIGDERVDVVTPGVFVVQPPGCCGCIVCR